MTANTHSLDMVRRDLSDTAEALAAYWGRNSQHELDYAVGDTHRAIESLTRAVSTLTLTIEQLTEQLDHVGSQSTGTLAALTVHCNRPGHPAEVMS